MIRKEIYKFYENILNSQLTLSKKFQLFCEFVYKNQRTEFSEEEITLVEEIKKSIYPEFQIYIQKFESLAKFKFSKRTYDVDHIRSIFKFINRLKEKYDVQDGFYWLRTIIFHYCKIYDSAYDDKSVQFFVIESINSNFCRLTDEDFESTGYYPRIEDINLFCGEDFYIDPSSRYNAIKRRKRI